jgi:hypothetical protein
MPIYKFNKIMKTSDLKNQLSKFLIILILFGHTISYGQSGYYLSSSEGNDLNNGTINSPWKTLKKINAISLKPGDKVFFKRDDTFFGHFVVNGSGSKRKPIIISSYAKGNHPVLNGAVGREKGGDYQEAMLILNNDNIIVENIEIQNNRLISRKGVRDQDAFGIHVLNNGNKSLKNFIFRNIIFKNVYASLPILKEKGENAFNGLEVAGLRFFSTRNKKNFIKNIQNTLVENCHFSNLQRLGVHVKHEGGETGVGTDKTNSNVDFILRNNEFHNTGGTCILPIRTYNCLIEKNIFDRPGDNSDPRMANRGSSVWTWRCINTVIQYNQCLHVRGYLDSHGIHIDHENVNTFIQYNYMEDCEGGFVEILGGNKNSVYRFNVSVNDGWRQNPKWKNSNHTFWINEVVPEGKHRADGNYIYNNTIYIDKPYSTAIDINGKNNYIYNNIFTVLNGAIIGEKQVLVKNNDTPLYQKNNLYEGQINTRFTILDSNPINGAAHFVNPKSGNKFGFQLKGNSDAINAGVAKLGPPIPGAGRGVFKNISKYPIVDFYGNPIDLSKGTPNIGACNAKKGEIGI